MGNPRIGESRFSNFECEIDWTKQRITSSFTVLVLNCQEVSHCRRATKFETVSREIQHCPAKRSHVKKIARKGVERAV